MRWCRAWAVMALLLCWARGAQAMEDRIGARPMGMGDAYVALATDVNALNYNPAGLALEKNIEASLEYADLYPGLNDGSIQENHLTYSQSLYDYGGFGLGWNNRSVTGVYTENEFMLGWAMRPDEKTPFWAGVTAKLLYFGYTDGPSLADNDYFSGQASKLGLGLDAGALYEPWAEEAGHPGLRVGLSALNLNEPDMGLKAEARQPLALRAGVGTTWKDWDGDLDLVYRDDSFGLRAGAERWFAHGRFGVRAGLIEGGDTAFTVTAGGTCALPVSKYMLHVNYAFNYPFGSIQETAGVHRLSVDFMFPLPSKEELKRLEEERQRRAQLEFEENRQKAYALFEKVRGTLVEMEIQPIHETHAADIERLKNDLLDVSNSMAQTEYASAIRGLNRIQQDIRKLQEKYAKEMGQPAPALKEEKIDVEQQAKREQVIKLVRAYLTKKVINYFSSRQEVKELRQMVDATLDAELYAIEMKLFEGRERLVTYRDWRGFLSCLNDASQQLEDFEKRTGKHASGGAVSQ